MTTLVFFICILIWMGILEWIISREITQRELALKQKCDDLEERLLSEFQSMERRWHSSISDSRVRVLDSGDF
jgi:hypothetical protein